VAVENNAVCSAGNVLPCLVCRDGATDFDPDTGLTCPGLPFDGSIKFKSDGVPDECRLQACPDLADAPLTCDGGVNNFQLCNNDGDCLGLSCLPNSICAEGPSVGSRCLVDADCGAGNRCLPLIRDLFFSTGGNAINDPSEGIIGATSVCMGGDCPEVEIEKVADCIPNAAGELVCRFSWQVTNTSVDQTATDCVVTDEYEAPSSTCAEVGNPPGCVDTADGAFWFSDTPIGDIPPAGTVPGGSDQPQIQGLTNVATVVCDGHDDVECLPPSDEAICTCPGEGCFTHTPGFWCNRPLATDFLLPLEVCGITLGNVDAATQGSAIEDLVFGRDHKIDNGRRRRPGVDPASLGYPNGIAPQNLQLVRQCTAATLNLAATLEADGDCDTEIPGISQTIENCCSRDLCTATASAISDSECIETLDAFNNADFGGIDFGTPEVFPTSKGTGMAGNFPPGRADSSTCREANGNGFINSR
jgi:hypothetical protein